MAQDGLPLAGKHSEFRLEQSWTACHALSASAMKAHLVISLGLKRQVYHSALVCCYQPCGPGCSSLSFGLCLVSHCCNCVLANVLTLQSLCGFRQCGMQVHTALISAHAQSCIQLCAVFLTVCLRLPDVFQRWLHCHLLSVSFSDERLQFSQMG